MEEGERHAPSAPVDLAEPERDVGGRRLEDLVDLRPVDLLVDEDGDAEAVVWEARELRLEARHRAAVQDEAPAAVRCHLLAHAVHRRAELWPDAGGGEEVSLGPRKGAESLSRTYPFVLATEKPVVMVARISSGTTCSPVSGCLPSPRSVCSQRACRCASKKLKRQRRCSGKLRREARRGTDCVPDGHDDAARTPVDRALVALEVGEHGAPRAERPVGRDVLARVAHCHVPRGLRGRDRQAGRVHAEGREEEAVEVGGEGRVEVELGQEARDHCEDRGRSAPPPAQQGRREVHGLKGRLQYWYLSRNETDGRRWRTLSTSSEMSWRARTRSCLGKPERWLRTSLRSASCWAQPSASPQPGTTSLRLCFSHPPRPASGVGRPPATEALDRTRPAAIAVNCLVLEAMEKRVWSGGRDQMSALGSKEGGEGEEGAATHVGVDLALRLDVCPAVALRLDLPPLLRASDDGDTGARDLPLGEDALDPAVEGGREDVGGLLLAVWAGAGRGEVELAERLLSLRRREGQAGRERHEREGEQGPAHGCGSGSVRCVGGDEGKVGVDELKRGCRTTSRCRRRWPKASLPRAPDLSTMRCWMRCLGLPFRHARWRPKEQQDRYVKSKVETGRHGRGELCQVSRRAGGRTSVDQAGGSGGAGERAARETEEEVERRGNSTVEASGSA